MEIIVTVVNFCNDFMCLHKKVQILLFKLLLQEIVRSELDSSALGGLIRNRSLRMGGELTVCVCVCVTGP